MSRGKKLLIVGLVLTVGIGLAWPFRKTQTDRALDPAAESVPVSGLSQTAATQRPDQPLSMGSPAPHVVAKMTSMAEGSEPANNPPAAASFDLANHPALTGLPNAETASPASPTLTPNRMEQRGTARHPEPVQEPTSDTRPAASTTQQDHEFDARKLRPAEIRHIVENSDTLEKLAKRYLGDESRALEIFDLNRDVLDNPHLLPINAQLRIPKNAQRVID